MDVHVLSSSLQPVAPTLPESETNSSSFTPIFTPALHYLLNTTYVKLRQPGIEPGSTAWKAAMLTIIPLTLSSL
jgi:hypothetical protein